MFTDLVIVRGGGDLATGVIQKLYRSGFKVLVLEVEKPTAIRRNVSLCEAIYDKRVTVEDVEAVLVKDLDDINKAWQDNVIPLAIDPLGEWILKIKPSVVVDAIIAKRNLGTSKLLAPITIALGPGFNAGVDVDVVIETTRGHELGKLIFEGYAKKNTGIPGEIGGVTKERVIYSPVEGVIKNIKTIGDIVAPGETIALIEGNPVKTEISGILRGIIRDGMHVLKGLKIADVDPRLDQMDNCHTISDKARNLGGAVLEAILYMKNKQLKRGE